MVENRLTGRQQRRRVSARNGGLASLGQKVENIPLLLAQGGHYRLNSFHKPTAGPYGEKTSSGENSVMVITVRRWPRESFRVLRSG